MKMEKYTRASSGLIRRCFLMACALSGLMFSTGFAQADLLPPTDNIIELNDSLVSDMNAQLVLSVTQGVFDSDVGTSSGGQYLAVDVGANLNNNVVVPDQVPLSAALWLFGSALIGFVLTSNRRSV